MEEKIMELISRRGFLKKSAVTSAGLMVSAPVIMKGLAKNSPNETINITVVGIRSQGTEHYRRWALVPNVKVVTLCDVNEGLFAKNVGAVEKLTGYRPKTEVDFRKVLDDKDVDAVSIATPDHWHALQTIWACQAGKDVYVEKPVSYTIDEGRKMVQAARKYNRVVQAGLQYRSDPANMDASKFIQEGGLGNIYMAKAIVLRARENIGKMKDSEVPKGINWDLFLGPAPYRPFNQNRFSYNWHWFWDTGTGEMGNNCVHTLDVVRWEMNKRVHPVKIHSTGGYYAFDSDQEIPNVQYATFEYEDGSVIHTEFNGLYTNKVPGKVLNGTKGYMEGNKVFFGRNNEPGPIFSRETKTKTEQTELVTGSVGVDHWSNFIECIRTRRWQDLNCDILEGHMSTALCLLANISFRTGRKLIFNPNSERFVNDDDANTYLTRIYRPPYVVPDEV